MKRGLEYVFSQQKRIFDRLTARTIQPIITLALQNGFTLEEHPRTGQCGIPFRQHKLWHPNDKWQAIDELGQILDIAYGTMSFVGWRPLEPTEHEEFMDCMSREFKRPYENIVLPTPPGIFSPFAVAYHSKHVQHSQDIHDIRAEMNIRFVLDASAFSDLGLVTRALGTALKNGPSK